MATPNGSADLPTKRSGRRNGEKRRLARPAGAEQPLVNIEAAKIAATKAMAEMPGNQLSDTAVTLVTLRVNSQMSVPAICKQLKMNRSHAYSVLASPSGQELMARMARSLLGYAATTATRTLEDLCNHKDPHVRMQAATDLMERAGLGLSQRAAPTSQASSFAFAFHAPTGEAKKP